MSLANNSYNHSMEMFAFGMKMAEQRFDDAWPTMAFREQANKQWIEQRCHGVSLLGIEIDDTGLLNELIGWSGYGLGFWGKYNLS